MKPVNLWLPRQYVPDIADFCRFLTLGSTGWRKDPSTVTVPWKIVLYRLIGLTFGFCVDLYSCSWTEICLPLASTGDMRVLVDSEYGVFMGCQ